MEREGRGRKGVVPLRFNLVPHRFLWASYGPDCMSALRLCDYNILTDNSLSAACPFSQL
jgi:hypothetical protein